MTAPVVLSIAGSDPSGGAGIQADLKTFGALGAYGAAVITSLTAQNTRGVQSVHPVYPDVVNAQLASVLGDLAVDAVKIGMLGDAATVDAVAAALGEHRPAYVVLDPVMVATSGDRLLAPEAVQALRSRLLSLADLITPNLPEAADLLGEPVAVDEAGMLEQAHRLQAWGTSVLLKGGHLGTPTSNDLLMIDGAATWLVAPRVATSHTHGTGCALSSAIAALRPQRGDWAVAATEAKHWLTEALLHAADVPIQRRPGAGHGPPHHFHAHWSRPEEVPAAHT